MTLEQTLAEIGPIFNKGSFAHASMQEITIAERFAIEINSGELKIRDAFNHYWSYEEKAELWDLSKDREWRGLLPSWKHLLPCIAEDLSPERAEELVEVLTKNYSNAKKFLAKGKYNPFLDDFKFLSEIRKHNPHLNKKEGKELAHNLVSRTTSEKVAILNRLAELRYLDTSLEYLLEDSKPEVRAAAVHYFGEAGHFTPKIFSLLKDFSGEYNIFLDRRVVRHEALNALEKLKGFDECMRTIVDYNLDMIDYVYMTDGMINDVVDRVGCFDKNLLLKLIKSSDRNTRRFATELIVRLAKKGRADYDEEIADSLIENILKSREDPTRYCCMAFQAMDNENTLMDCGIRALLAIKCPPEKVAVLLEDEYPVTRAFAAKAMGKFGYYDERLKTLMKDSSHYVKAGAIIALGELRKISFEELVTLSKDPNKMVSHVAQTASYKCKTIRNQLHPESDEKIYNKALSLLESFKNNPRVVPSLIRLIPELSAENQEVAFQTIKGDYLSNRPWLAAFIEAPDFKDTILKVLSGPYNIAKLSCLLLLREVEYYDKQVTDEIANLLETKPSTDERHNEIREQLLEASLDYLTEVKQYDPRVAALLTSENSDLQSSVAIFFEHLGMYDERLLPLLKSEDSFLRQCVIDALGASGHYDKQLLRLIPNSEENNTDSDSERSQEIDSVRKALENSASLQIIKDIKEMYGLKSEGELKEIIGAIHERIKPQGYNPAIKRLINDS